ncbi:MAG: hypothetical protein LBV06_03135, partial [Propionibacteriaceae bacterium]|nr:hypothetical protein [Propionibacteriaceae bacterium]
TIKSINQPIGNPAMNASHALKQREAPTPATRSFLTEALRTGALLVSVKRQPNHLPQPRINASANISGVDQACSPLRRE